MSTWEDYSLAVKGFSLCEAGNFKKLMNVVLGRGVHKTRTKPKDDVLYAHFRSYRHMKTVLNSLNNQIFFEKKLTMTVIRCLSEVLVPIANQTRQIFSSRCLKEEIAKEKDGVADEKDDGEEKVLVKKEKDKRGDEQVVKCKSEIGEHTDSKNIVEETEYGDEQGEEKFEDKEDEDNNGSDDEPFAKKPRKEKGDDDDDEDDDDDDDDFFSKEPEPPKHENPASKLKRVTSQYRQNFESYPLYKELIDKRKAENNGMICPLSEFKQPNAGIVYTTECVFTIGVNEVTGKPTVGFDNGLGLVKDISSVEHHYPDHVIKAAKIFEIFVKEAEDALANKIIRCKFWFELVIRTNEAKELMLVVLVTSKKTLNEIETNFLVDFFKEKEGKECNISSLYTKASYDSFSFKLVMGVPYLEETIVNLKFQLPPQKIIWLGVQGADVLCSSVKEVLAPAESSSLLVVGDTTGVLSLYMSKYVKNVMCVDKQETINEGVTKHAELNGITNCSFFGGKPNTIFWKVQRTLNNEEVFCIVVVSEKSSYASPIAIDGIRRMKQIKHLLVVMEMPKRNLVSLILLTKPPVVANMGEPFFLVKAVPVDSKPFSQNYVMLFLMERWECGVLLNSCDIRPKGYQNRFRRRSGFRKSKKQKKMEKQKLSHSLQGLTAHTPPSRNVDPFGMREPNPHNFGPSWNWGNNRNFGSPYGQFNDFGGPQFGGRERGDGFMRSGWQMEPAPYNWQQESSSQQRQRGGKGYWGGK